MCLCQIQKEFLKETSLVFGVGCPLHAKEGHESPDFRWRERDPLFLFSLFESNVMLLKFVNHFI